VWNYGAGSGSEGSLKNFRKDLISEVYNEAGQLTMATRFADAGFQSTKPCVI
jgi:hypothetical protein